MSQPHKPRKRFGQNFLRDAHVLERILQSINPHAEDHLVEIGPGEGVLTRLLLPLCDRIDIIEIDRDLITLLTERYGEFQHLTIHNADALEFELSSLDAQQPMRIIGNLPYNISTPLLFHLFDQLPLIQDMHFLLQKEVVERLTAPVNDKHYGRLSVMAQYYCHCDHLFNVGPQAFFPPPKVESSVIRMSPIQDRKLEAKDPHHLSEVVKQAFTYRRKTLSNSLKPFLSPQELEALGIDPKQRPQELDVASFVSISNSLLVK